MPLSVPFWPSRVRRRARAMQRASVRVVVVCAANLCRSPMAAGMLRYTLAQAGLLEQVFVDSAGTHSAPGSPPDLRSQKTAARRAIDISAMRSRVITPADLAAFDYVLAMDQAIYQHLVGLCEQPEQRARVQLFLRYAPALGEDDVPDPYFGAPAGFERVMDLIEAGAQGFLSHLRAHHKL